MKHPILRSPAVAILAIWAAGLGAAAQFGKISVIFEGLRLQYAGQSAVQLGLIVSVVGMVGLIFGTTAGLFVARIGPRRVMVACLAMGAGMSALQTLGLGYGLMIASRVVEGASHLGIVVVGPTLIAALASDRYRGLAMTLWSSFFGVSYALLALFAAGVIARFGPEGLFWGHAAWMAALAAILFLILPPDPRSVVMPGAKGILAQHVEIYGSAWLSAPALGFFSYTFLYVAVLTLLPSEVPDAQRGLVAAGMPLISIVASLTLGVWMLSQVTAVRLVQMGYAMSIPGFVGLALMWGQGPAMAFAALWIAASLGLVQGASFASIPQINADAYDRARAAGAVAQLGNLGTTTGTPILAAVMVTFGPWGLAVVAFGAYGLGILIQAILAGRRRQLVVD